MLIIGARLIVSSARLVPCARLRISTQPTAYGTQPLTSLTTESKLGQGLNFPTSTGPNHGVDVVRLGEFLVPEPVPDDDVNPCGVEGMAPMVVGECLIMQNSWGATRG
jgi:hypothetical protein